MSDPLSALALAAGKRVLWRTVFKVVAWCLPVILVGVLVLVVYATVLAGGEGADGAEGFGTCGVKAPAVGSAILELDPEQIANAQTIAAVGRRFGVPARGLVVALATAMQESTLHNLPYGDRDSVGLFQQRTPWGSRDERMDPATSSELFFTGGRGGQPGLIDISGYLELPVAVAAQAVQRSAFPNAYAKWEGLANRLLQFPAVAQAACVPRAGGQGASSIVEAATRWLGTPYSWGGGTLLGPSVGIGTGSSTVGFDCSGLTRYAVYAATGRVIPRVATDQAAALAPVPLDQIQAGDLLFFHDPEDPEGFFGHVGIADGAGGMVHAPTTGSSVQVMPALMTNSYWGERLSRAGRA